MQESLHSITRVPPCEPWKFVYSHGSHLAMHASSLQALTAQVRTTAMMGQHAAFVVISADAQISDLGLKTLLVLQKHIRAFEVKVNQLR